MELTPEQVALMQPDDRAEVCTQLIVQAIGARLAEYDCALVFVRGDDGAEVEIFCEPLEHNKG